MKKSSNNGVLELVKEYRKYLIAAGILAAIYIVATAVVPNINKAMLAGSPVTAIEAECNKSYLPNQKISPSDFSVTAIHENGKRSAVNNKSVVLNTTKVTPYGKTTPVAVSLKEDASISCIVKVKNTREKLQAFPCGLHGIDNARAVFYSNGELCFEGEGDLLQFSDYPWKEADIDVTAVTFSEGVAPTNLDNYFSDMDELAYVGKLPASVESMSNTFEDCESLVGAPDWSRCTNLSDVSGCFSGCTSLEKIPAIPESVTNIDYMCDGCFSLKEAPVMENAIKVASASYAFHDCERLIRAAVPPNAEDVSYMYAGCINLKEMPEIPETVIDMASMFKDGTSLKTLTSIPSKVKDVSSCFAGCSRIEGVLRVDGNPKNYYNCFDGAALATTVDLQGDSAYKDLLAGTGESILVNGALPNPEIQSISDVEKFNH